VTKPRSTASSQIVSRGHEVTVLCGTPNYPAGRIFDGFGWFRRTRERWNGVEVVRVPVVPRGNSARWRLAANYLSYALAASVLGPFRCRGRIDAILAKTFGKAPRDDLVKVMIIINSLPDK